MEPRRTTEQGRFRHAIGAGAFFLVLVAPAAASAQTLRSVPLGGRTATMGGAGTAFGNDSAMPYLNPAGLAGLPLDVLGLSATAYGISRFSGNSALSPGGHSPVYGPLVSDGTTSQGTTTFELPSALLYARHISEDRHQVLAISVTTPRAVKRSLVVSASTEFPQRKGNELESYSYQFDTRDYYIGPSYAIEVAPWLRLGASVFGIYNDTATSASRSVVQSYRGGLAGVTASEAFAEKEHAWGLTGVLGLQAMPVENLWIGAALEAPSVHLGGRIDGKQTGNGSVTTSGVTFASATDNDYTGRYRADRPLRVSLGVGYDKRRSFAVAVDGTFTAGRSRAERDDQVVDGAQHQTGELDRRYRERWSFARDYEPSFDLSAGAEVWVSSLVAVRAGGFLDRSRLVVPPTSTQIEVEDLKYWGVSSGVGILVGSFDLTFGGVYRHGSGDLITTNYNGSAPLYFDTIGLRSSGENSRAAVSDDTLLVVIQGIIGLEEAKQKLEQSVPVQALPVNPMPAISTPTTAPPAPPPPTPTPPAPSPPPAEPPPQEGTP